MQRFFKIPFFAFFTLNFLVISQSWHARKQRLLVPYLSVLRIPCVKNFLVILSWHRRRRSLCRHFVWWIFSRVTTATISCKIFSFSFSIAGSLSKKGFSFQKRNPFFPMLRVLIVERLLLLLLKRKSALGRFRRCRRRRRLRCCCCC